MPATVLLITPPFTQLNTPYPATAYLKGFLNTRNISSFQSDLGIEVILKLFSREGMQKLFAYVQEREQLFSPEAARILSLRHQYIHTIDAVIRFLQGRDPGLAQRICRRPWLPEGARFVQLNEELDHAFGIMGLQDKAKHLATMYLEDLADFIKETADKHFGFSRYAERLGRSAATFDALHESLQLAPTFTDEIMLPLLQQHIAQTQPKLVAFSVPFPGNLYAAFRCAQWIRKNHPEIRIAMGGGFANTELRSVSDARVFEYVHFITLDDGEAPVEALVHHVAGNLPESALKRTFLLHEGNVAFVDNPACADIKQEQTGTPDYSDLPLNEYISAIEVMNPMHAMWSDGRWNKLTMAHGCYWGKCTFCDITLPYIADYEPISAATICDRMEAVMAQTGQSGFHFVDEAAPPALMRALALEILRRNIVVTWWTNVRFEKSFTRDLCLLLKASGCIAVSGGLEVASDRLLALIRKGITVEQVARVTKHFTESGIMVHAYLMYGFPTQTAQETVDSLEMVRQLFAAGTLQSGFWHRFAMTAHSPVGKNPEAYQVINETTATGTFANNDLEHTDTAADHNSFSYGLKKSLHNYMHGVGLDWPLHKWFDGMKLPRTTIPPDFIKNIVAQEEYLPLRNSAKVVFIGQQPQIDIVTKTKKGETWEQAALTFQTAAGPYTIKLSPEQGRWLQELLPKLSPSAPMMTLEQIVQDYLSHGLTDFELFWENKPANTLYRAGLLQV